MNTSIELTLVFCAGAAAALVALLPAFHAARRNGWESGRAELQPEILEAFARGKAAGWQEMSRGLVVDLGPAAARRLADRMAAMDSVQSLAAGKRAPREPEPPASFTHEDER